VKKHFDFKEVIDSFITKTIEELRNTEIMSILKGMRKFPE